MGSLSPVTSGVVSAGWQAVKDTVRGALHGEMDDIAKVAVVAGMATNAVPVAAGLSFLAGKPAVGAIIDAFA